MRGRWWSTTGGGARGSGRTLPAREWSRFRTCSHRPALPSPAEAIRFRQQLGVDPGAFLFGVFGYLRESKRLASVLRAFRELRRGGARAALLVAGEFVSSDLERAVGPLLADSGVVRLPHLPEREFWKAAAAVDACINLRYPAAGETSGIAIRLMGIGKPVLVTESRGVCAVPGRRLPAGRLRARRSSIRSRPTWFC